MLLKAKIKSLVTTIQAKVEKSWFINTLIQSRFTSTDLIEQYDKSSQVKQPFTYFDSYVSPKIEWIKNHNSLFDHEDDTITKQSWFYPLWRVYLDAIVANPNFDNIEKRTDNVSIGGNKPSTKSSKEKQKKKTKSLKYIGY